MKNTKPCPICDEGVLVERNYTSTISYKNAKLTIDGFKHSICNCCGSEIANQAQAKANKLLVIDFQRQADGLLPSIEVNRIRKKVGQSILDASSIIAGGGVAFSKYENGTITQSLAADNLLRLLDRHPNLIEELHDYRKSRLVHQSTIAEFFVLTNLNSSHEERMQCSHRHTFFQIFRSAITSSLKTFPKASEPPTRNVSRASTSTQKFFAIGLS